MEPSSHHNPYRFWKSGFAFELALIAGAVAVTAGLSLLTWAVLQ